MTNSARQLRWLRWGVRQVGESFLVLGDLPMDGKILELHCDICKIHRGDVTMYYVEFQLTRSRKFVGWSILTIWKV